jgi:hypothetical protein
MAVAAPLIPVAVPMETTPLPIGLIVGSEAPAWLKALIDKGTPHQDWAPWQKGCLKRLLPKRTGAAALSVAAKHFGVVVPRGHATVSIAEALKLPFVVREHASARQLVCDVVRRLPRWEDEGKTESNVPAAKDDDLLVVHVHVDQGETDVQVLATGQVDALSESAAAAAVDIATSYSAASFDSPRRPWEWFAFILEQPQNALWPLLLMWHPSLVEWPKVTTSLCKRREWRSSFRHTSTYMASLPSDCIPNLPPACTPTSPCRMVQENGRHDRVVGGSGDHGVSGYFARSHQPASLVADLVEGWAKQAVAPTCPAL